MAPGARLVKSISNMPMAWIQDFSPGKPRTVIFASGDDTAAKRTVMELIDGIGLGIVLRPAEIVVLPRLSTPGAERMAAE